MRAGGRWARAAMAPLVLGLLAADPAREPAPSAPSEALVAATLALQAGDYDEALARAAEVPAEGRQAELAADLQARVTHAVAKERSALRSWRRAVDLASASGGDPGPYLLEIADLWRGVNFLQGVEDTLAKVGPGSELRPQAVAEQAWVHFQEGDTYSYLPLALVLEGPLADRWYLPGIDVYRASSYIDLCRYDDATRALARGEASLETLRQLLATIRSEDDPTLWERWSRDGWVDPHLRAFLHGDPLLRMASPRADAGADVDARAATLYWLRERLAQAEARRAEALAVASRAHEDLLTQPEKRPQKDGILTSSYYDPRWRHPIWVGDTFKARYHDEDLRFYTYNGKNACYAPGERPLIIEF